MAVLKPKQREAVFRAIADAAIPASFEAFQLTQSVAAARKCQVACNNQP